MLWLTGLEGRGRTMDGCCHTGHDYESTGPGANAGIQTEIQHSPDPRSADGHFRLLHVYSWQRFVRSYEIAAF